MKKRLLLSTPFGAPGPMTAFRNHKAILEPYIACDLVPLEELVSPSFLKPIDYKRIIYRIGKRTKMIFSVKNIMKYGDNIIFGTFGSVHEGIIKKLNKHGIKPSFMWCSTLGQMELTPYEMRNFMRLVELRKKGYVNFLFLQHRLYNSVGHFVKEATLLPYSIDLSPYKVSEQIELPGINIDLFCRPRQGKNILNQIASFTMAGINGKLHINFETDFLSGIPNLLSKKIVYHKWIPDSMYYNFIAGMDLSLQVTIGESFNYVACERMCLGVPVLTTKDIYLVADDNFLAKYLCVEAPDTPTSIAARIKFLIDEDNLRKELAIKCKSRIENIARCNNSMVVDIIQKYFNT